MPHHFALESTLALTKNTPLFRKFLDGYCDARNDKLLPTLQDCLLSHLASLADEFTVFEILPPDKLVYRLCGTKVVERIGFEMTGLNVLDFLPAESREISYYDVSTMVTWPCGNYSRYNNQYAHGRVVESESVSLPVLSDSMSTKPYILALHSVEGKRYEVGEGKGETRIGVDWIMSAFLDIGTDTPGQTSYETYLRLQREEQRLAANG